MKTMILNRRSPRWMTLLTLTLLLFAACSKSKKPVAVPDGTTDKEKVDVYYSHVDLDLIMQKGNSKIMKNGKQIFSFSDPERSVLVSALDVADGKVYAAGSAVDISDNHSIYQARVWNNGVEKSYAAKGVLATDIVKKGNDLYFLLSSVEHGASQVWKNDKMLFQMPDFFAIKLVIVGSDIYVGGSDGDAPVIVKNGDIVYKYDGESGEVYSLWVEGDVVYSAGRIMENGKFVGKVWKNASLLYDLGPGEATDLCVSGTSVYISGYSRSASKSIAKVWKDGQQLYNLTSDEGESMAAAVAVYDNDVYVGGLVENKGPRIWKNGQLLYVMEGSSVLNSLWFSMKVVPKK